MKKAARILGWITALLLTLGWALDAQEWAAFEVQRDVQYRMVSGFVLFGLILFQWSLSLGRVVFQKTGSDWGRWVDWHLGSALALPFAILAHGVRWGWGMLFLLPVSLLAAGHFGSLLDTTDRTRKYLPYHIAFSALALALTLVHLYTAVMYR